MIKKPFKWTLLKLYFDPCVHQLVDKVGAKRFADAEESLRATCLTKDDVLPGYPYEPPWSVPFGDRRYSLQARQKYGLLRIKRTIESPEWLVVLTARHIKLNPDAFLYGVVEYQLTNSNEINAIVPKKLSELGYLWWRLEHYFGITPKNSYFFTDDLLEKTLEWAKFMFVKHRPY